MPSIPDHFSRFTYFRGRVALAEILRGLGVGPGDKVALQAFTCVAVPEAVMSIGAIPLWVDVAPQTVNMSSNALKDVWSDEIKAVIVQHTFGIMADMDGLNAVIGGRAPVIEDCCHSYLSSLDGRQAGRFGVASFYSFEWGKPLILGAGGAAVTEDKNLAAKLAERQLTFDRPGMKTRFKLALQRIAFSILYRPSLYWTVKRLFQRLSRAGLAVGNYNPVGPGMLSDDFQTKMSTSGETRLKRLLKNVRSDSARRKELAKTYQAALGSKPGIRLVKTVPGAQDVLIRFPVMVDDKVKLLELAEASRVETAEWYATPVHPLPEADWAQVGYTANSCPNAQDMAGCLVSFPMGPTVTRKSIAKAARMLEK